MQTAELHQLLLDAATGDKQALERLSNLVTWGEVIERAFLEHPDARMVKVPLRLVKTTQSAQ